jgi:hypothetical protein
MICRGEERGGEVCRKTRHIRIVRRNRNGCCDAPISKLLEGLHKSGVEGARADDMPKLQMTRALYHSTTPALSNIHFYISASTD